MQDVAIVVQNLTMMLRNVETLSKVSWSERFLMINKKDSFSWGLTGRSFETSQPVRK